MLYIKDGIDYKTMNICVKHNNRYEQPYKVVKKINGEFKTIWPKVSVRHSNKILGAVAYSELLGKYIAKEKTTSKIYTSTDSINWELSTLIDDIPISNDEENNLEFFIEPHSNRIFSMIKKSEDGEGTSIYITEPLNSAHVTWNTINLNMRFSSLNPITYIEQLHRYIILNRDYVAHSDDYGATWTVTTPKFNFSGSPGLFMIVIYNGNNKKVYAYDRLEGTCFISDDGMIWDEVKNSNLSSLRGEKYNLNDGYFEYNSYLKKMLFIETTSSWEPLNIYISDDNVTWEKYQTVSAIDNWYQVYKKVKWLPNSKCYVLVYVTRINGKNMIRIQTTKDCKTWTIEATASTDCSTQQTRTLPLLLFLKHNSFSFHINNDNSGAEDYCAQLNY